MGLSTGVQRSSTEKLNFFVTNFLYFFYMLRPHDPHLSFLKRLVTYGVGRGNTSVCIFSCFHPAIIILSSCVYRTLSRYPESGTRFAEIIDSDKGPVINYTRLDD